mgnify:CR=1 FL=1
MLGRVSFVFMVSLLGSSLAMATEAPDVAPPAKTPPRERPRRVRRTELPSCSDTCSCYVRREDIRRCERERRRRLPPDPETTRALEAAPATD